MKSVRSIFIEVCSRDRCARASQTSAIIAIAGVVIEVGSMYGWHTARSLGVIVVAAES